MQPQDKLKTIRNKIIDYIREPFGQSQYNLSELRLIAKIIDHFDIDQEIDTF